MGYFANGTEGDIFQEKFCFRCVNYRDLDDGRGPGCPVWDAHLLYAYDLCNATDDPGKQILDMLIEQPDGIGNRCTMFVEGGESEDEREARNKEATLYQLAMAPPAEKEGWGSMDRLTGGTAPAAEEICVCRHGKDTYCGAWDCEQPAEKEETFERSLLRADIKAGNADAAEAQLQRIKRLEADSPPAEEEGT